MPDDETGTGDAVADSDDRPAWWLANEALRREMDLADYEPPRFADGTYTHEVVEPLERQYGCRIQFRSDLNPAYPEDWAVLVDRESVAPVGRHRDQNGNTVYETTPEAFRRTVLEYVERRDDASEDA